MPISRNTSERLLFFFFFKCNVSNRNLPFFVFPKILEVLNYFGCLPKICPSFSALKRCSTKGFYSATRCDEILLFCTSGKKQKSEFTKHCSPSKVFFKEFDLKFRTARLKSTYRWLLLGTIIF